MTDDRGQRTEGRGHRSRKVECGLRPLRAVGSLYEPEAVGAIGAYAPEGSGNAEGGMGKLEWGIRNWEKVKAGLV